MPANLKVDASYIGTRGLHLTSDYQLDSLNPSCLSLGTALQTSVPNPFQPYVKIGALSNATITRQQLLLPYPQFTGVLEENATWGGSNYQAAQVKINKLPTHGVSFLVAYTFSKWMSNVPSADAAIETTNSTGVQNYYDLAAENSLSEDDFPQSLIVNVVADLPFGRGKYLVGNVNSVIGQDYRWMECLRHSHRAIGISACLACHGSRRRQPSEPGSWRKPKAPWLPASRRKGYRMV